MTFLRGAGIVGLLFFVLTAVARADSDPFSGQWRQLTSTAGQCDRCYIGIGRHGDVLTVTSNNGWHAVVNVDRFDDLQLAAGKGQWKPTVAGVYGGKSFGIQFIRRRGQLQMFMVVAQAGGPPLVISATFEKGPPPSDTRPQPAPEIHRI